MYNQFMDNQMMPNEQNMQFPPEIIPGEGIPIPTNTEGDMSGDIGNEIDMQGLQMGSAPVYDGSPYFMGDQALIKFSGEGEGFGIETYWLVDKKNRTIRPFESKGALDEVFGQDLNEALKNIMVIVPPSIDEGGKITEGVLSGFTILGPEYAIKDDGTSKELSFSPHELGGRYGKPINEELEGLATEAVDGFLGILKTSEGKTGLKSSFIEELKEDDQLMAFYISALAYGNYTLEDIYGDILSRSRNKEI